MNAQIPAPDALRVSIVDDEPPARERLGRLLPDVALLDVRMPGMDGIEAAIERRSEGQHLVRMTECEEALPVSRRHATEALRQLRGGH